ncbi:DUF4278 domain-containing protein [Pseudanabaena sp. PCC 6802]|uniref:DUF4278 domain-containing protein n=1 Tax=Pseudanabaena sp. PCC 6802 TaxID=118173 RepID=UPI00036D5ABD|nr:DUF4278 domain-containing protein [Pseudanabaena sp. PCC 6802]
MHPAEMCNPLAIEITSNEPTGKYRGANITKQNQIKMPVAVEAIINLKYRGITYQIVADPYLYRNLIDSP